MSDFHPNIKKDIIFLIKRNCVSNIVFFDDIKNTPEFVSFMRKNVYWGDVSKLSSLSEEFIEFFKNSLNMLIVLQYQRLSESLLEKYWDEFVDQDNTTELTHILYYQDLSEDFIRRRCIWGAGERFWYSLAKGQFLSDAFIRDFIQKLPVIDLIKRRRFSEEMLEFILRNGYVQDRNQREDIVGFILSQEVLTEKIIRVLLEKYVDRKDLLPWFRISAYCALSEEFIDEYSIYIKWKLLWDNPNVEISESFFNKHIDCFEKGK